MADQTHHRGMLTLTIDDAEEYFKTHSDAGNRRLSLPITLCGLGWELEAYREVSDGIPWLFVYVTSYNDQIATWSCKATCVLRVRSSLPDDKTMKFCHEFTHKAVEWGCYRFITIEVRLGKAVRGRRSLKLCFLRSCSTPHVGT